MFSNCKHSYDAKADLAFKLAYVGTRECVIALLEGLECRIVEKGSGWIRSAPYAILRSLGMIFPDDPRFTTEIALIGLYGNHRYGKADEYIADVVEWADKKYNVKLSKFKKGDILVEFYFLNQLRYKSK